MEHPLDESRPARQLLRMAANAMARKLRFRIGLAGDAVASDADLQLTVGVDVSPSGKPCFSAMRWKADGTGEVIDFGVLPPE